MTRVRILAADDHRVLEKQLNQLLEQHTHDNVRFLQLVGNGDVAYAVLVAWDERE